MSPKKPEWMQIAEDDNASSNVRKVDKRLTLGTLATVGAIVIAGSLFANASDEPSAVADVTSIASPTTPAAEPATPTSSAPSAVTAPAPKKFESPSIAQLPEGGRDDEDGDHEGRERGEGRGEHRDRFEGHQDGDDD
jgi:hypothetical protein